MSEKYASIPIYRCHKEVRAFKIKAIEESNIEEASIDQAMRLIPEDASIEPVLVSVHWLVEKKAQVGGYFVAYADGYTSYSPAEAFEAGYARL